MAVLGAVSGRIVEKRGSKPAFLMGLFVVAAGFLVMAFLWQASTSILWILLAYALVGMGVGLSVTPASRSLTASMPKARAGMGSALVDLTRDFGGAVMQAVLGVLLATVYSGYFSKAFANLPPEQAQELGSSAAQEIASSYSGAMEVAKSFPAADAEQLVAAANKAFSEGKTVAYVVALSVTVLAFVLVWWRYPRKDDEEAYYAQVQAADTVTTVE
jgi:MFS family permease